MIAMWWWPFWSSYRYLYVWALMHTHVHLILLRDIHTWKLEALFGQTRKVPCKINTKKWFLYHLHHLTIFYQKIKLEKLTKVFIYCCSLHQSDNMHPILIMHMTSQPLQPPHWMAAVVVCSNEHHSKWVNYRHFSATFIWFSTNET